MCQLKLNWNKMNLQKRVSKYAQQCQHTPWALVTGGSSGMGLQYARQLAEAGCNLLLVSNQEKELEKVSAELSSQFGVEVVSRFQDHRRATGQHQQRVNTLCQHRHPPCRPD